MSKDGLRVRRPQPLDPEEKSGILIEPGVLFRRGPFFPRVMTQTTSGRWRMDDAPNDDRNKAIWIKMALFATVSEARNAVKSCITFQEMASLTDQHFISMSVEGTQMTQQQRAVYTEARPSASPPPYAATQNQQTRARDPWTTPEPAHASGDPFQSSEYDPWVHGERNTTSSTSGRSVRDVD